MTETEPERWLSEWHDARVAMDTKVRAHPRFHQLVREVAIQEQPRHPHLFWKRRNSLTYGTWMTRGMPEVDMGLSRRRVHLLAQQIAKDCEIFRDYPHQEYEGEALVFNVARDNVRARLR